MLLFKDQLGKIIHYLILNNKGEVEIRWIKESRVGVHRMQSG